MTITLSTKAQKLLNERLKSGRYGGAGEVVLAALASLKRQDELGDFAPGELERIVADGERSIRDEGVFPADDVLASLRERARSARRRTSKGGGRRRGTAK